MEQQQKKDWKKNIQFPRGLQKIETSHVPSSAFYFEGWARHFRRLHLIKFFKNYMDSKIIKPHQCFLEQPYAVLIEFST